MGHSSSVKRSLRVFLLVVALVLNVLWSNMGMHLEPRLQSDALSADLVAAIACYAGYVVAAVPLVMCPQVLARTFSRRAWYWALALAMAFVSLMAVVSRFQELLPVDVFSTLSLFLFGVVCTLNKAAIYLPLIRLATRFEFFAAMVVTHLVVKLFSLFASLEYGAVLILVVFVLPFAMAACAWLAPCEEKTVERGASPHLCVLLVVASAAVTLGDYLCGSQTWTVNLGSIAHTQEWAPLGLLLGLLVCVVLSFGSVRINALWTIVCKAQPLFFVVLAVLVLERAGFVSRPVGASSEATALSIVAAYFHVMIWVLLYDAIRVGGLSEYRAYGIFTIAIHAFDMLWVIAIAAGSEAVYAMSILIGLGIVGVGLFLPAMVSRISTVWRPAQAADSTDETSCDVQGTLQLRCASLAESHELSDREHQMLVLLAQGYTKRSIGENLSLSEGTVKTHIAHLYFKLGIHSQNELAEMVYGPVRLQVSRR